MRWVRLSLFWLLATLTILACQPAQLPDATRLAEPTQSALTPVSPAASPVPDPTPTAAAAPESLLPTPSSGTDPIPLTDLAMTRSPWLVCERGGGTCLRVEKPRPDPICEPANGTCVDPVLTRSPSAAYGALGIVREAYSAILDHYVDPVDPALLLQAALDATTAEVARRGGSTPATGSLPPHSSREAAWEAFGQLYQKLSAQVTDLSPQQLAHAAIRGMAASLHEQHTAFFSPPEYQEHLAWARGDLTYGGIGIHLSSNPPTIYEIFPHSPAEQAGLRYGDEIVAVDGRPTAGLHLDEVIAAIRGPDGTTVRLTVRRSEGWVQTVALRRERITVQFVEARMLDGQIGYIRVRGFPTSSVAEDLEKALRNLREHGAEALLLDLRGNGGGRLDVGLDSLGLFISDKNAYVEVGRDGKRLVRTPRGDTPGAGFPLAVLVDETTASMGEIFAAAIQDHRVGHIIGATTAGNVAAGQVFPLSDGSAVQVTVFRIETPLGTRLDGVGVRPDQAVERTPADVRDSRDPQLEAAMSYLSRVLNHPSSARPTPEGVPRAAQLAPAALTLVWPGGSSDRGPQGLASAARRFTPFRCGCQAADGGC